MNANAILENNENYEELKGTAKTFLQVITSNDLYYGIFLLIVMVVCLKIVDLVSLPFRKKGKTTIMSSFLAWCIKAFIIITFGMKILTLSEALSGFASQILMSSSLIVVVLGFVFQEGLSNIVHGLILTIFQPFKLGDRVSVTVDGTVITGYIQTINLRNTIIMNVMNSSHVIIPNSKMDLCIIENQYFGKEMISSSFMDLCITYESNLRKAMDIISEVIAANPLVTKYRTENSITEPVPVMVRELQESGIALRGFVTTLTIEENFGAASDIRKELVLRFQQEPDVEFAYPHIEVVPKSENPQQALQK